MDASAPLALATAQPEIPSYSHGTRNSPLMRPLRVLVADDDIVSRLQLVRAVRRLGHTVLVASDGLQALELFTTQRADVVVTDWLMPGIDGPELCRRVRGSGETSTYTPFIFLTTLDDQEHARQALEIGADDYLYKPLDMNALWARLIVVQRLKQLEGDRQRLLAAERAARAEAEAAVRTRDDVLAAVMHDLRTPLTVISASTQLMQRRIARHDIGSLAQPLQCDTERIAAAAVRMDQWIDDLLNSTLLRGGDTVTLRPTTFDLVQLAHRAVDDHQSTTARHQIGLKTTSASLIGAWDESQLRRALDNLLTNAIKYSPDGGGITVTIEEIVTPLGTTATLQVQDEGVGIPSKDLDLVFSRYKRAGNVRHIAGQGIGLAGVRQIVEQHGGTVSVRSDEWAGSEFTLSLPCVREVIPHAAHLRQS